MRSIFKLALIKTTERLKENNLSDDKNSPGFTSAIKTFVDEKHRERSRLRCLTLVIWEKPSNRDNRKWHNKCPDLHLFSPEGGRCDNCVMLGAPSGSQ